MPENPADKPAQLTAYHVKHGASVMYAIDAESAVARFPDEWSFEPWPDSPEAGADTSGVEIPADWQSQSKTSRRMLAIRLGAPKNVNTGDADKVIQDELDRRAAVAEH